MNDKNPLPTADATKGERTRTDIIEAAHDLFIQNGYHGTSMRQIAAQAGIALGGIYNHFSGKEDIFREVILTYHPYQEIMPILANTPHEHLEDFLREAARLIDQTLTQRPDLINLVFIEIVEFQSKHIQELIDQFFPQIIQILQRFMAADDTLRPMPIPMMMRTFMGTILGYVITKNVLGENIAPEFRENALNYFIDVYLRGILKTETKP